MEVEAGAAAVALEVVAEAEAVAGDVNGILIKVASYIKELINYEK
jgi:hypothetical protein